MLIAFFETRPGEKEFLQSHLSDHQLLFFEHPVAIETFPKEAQDIEILSTHTGSKIDQKLITDLKNLKMIASRTTGFDHIDLEAAKQKGAVVCNVPSYGESTVAEFTFGLILAISRKIPQALNRIKQENKFEFWGLQGFDLVGKCLGVIGTGKIGTNVIKMAKGFKMEVIAFDVFPNETLSQSLDFKYVSLDELLEKSDIVSLHVPSLPSTYHLINIANISKIKRGAVLINTSRGGVIETAALLQALKDKTISAAGLDVLECEDELKKNWQMCSEETAKQNLELINMPNVFITPHTAFNTKEAEERILQTTLENIKGFLEGNLKNVVKPNPTN